VGHSSSKVLLCGQAGGKYRSIAARRTAARRAADECQPELSMGWVDPWVGLGWVEIFVRFWWVGFGWVGSTTAKVLKNL